MDETYIKLRRKWVYYYRAVDHHGQNVDFMLSEHRDLGATRRFFKKAMAVNGIPERVVIDKSGANLTVSQAVNTILKFIRRGHAIAIRQVKYHNNILEQDHRSIKRLTRPMMGFKSLEAASATLAGIEVAHITRKGQFVNEGHSPFQTFVKLAA